MHYHPARGTWESSLQVSVWEVEPGPGGGKQGRMTGTQRSRQQLRTGTAGADAKDGCYEICSDRDKKKMWPRGDTRALQKKILGEQN